MHATGRLVPRDPCAIATPTCANVDPPAGKDQLLPFQEDRIRTEAQSLFSVGGVTATATLHNDCSALSTSCGFTLALAAPPGSTESLDGFKMRFLTQVNPLGASYNNPFISCSVAF